LNGFYLKKINFGPQRNKCKKDFTGQAGFTGLMGFFIACGEAPFGRRPFYPDNPVDPVF
jgi:hypothetical protein